MSTPSPIKGRGASSYLPGRFETQLTEAVDDGWATEESEEFAQARLRTDVRPETARSIISRNTSPDVGFSQSVNPYRGCEHGCSYCFARPTHAYLNLSPGLDFETKIFAKVNAADVLRRELSRPGYVPQPIALGINTDAYQPIERKLGITRQLIEVMLETRHPFSLITKNALVERDIDLLAPLAGQQLVSVHFSVTSLDPHLSAKLEPRASAPHARLRAMRRLSQAGIPVGVMVAPVIPWINDAELEAVLEAARDAGACSAGYVLLRLPYEVAPLFRDWLQAHYPQRAEHVMSTINQLRGGKDYDSQFGKRMRGEGAYADLLSNRFKLARKRLGFDAQNSHWPKLDCSRFIAPAPPKKPSLQGELF
ncbi:MAG: PA0069 family radical SAM protein [Stenotrophomonas sp.]|jgi:DNA repair photolyase|uniref:PA0069 family radical SAM protein n=1 Tax=unclassified Stenotrophomonas TaxID=196198 RepID=UPI00177FC84C|nr:MULTISPECIES: PA0069 family radical SAM protein [unclassified Stenotrophomonas]MBD9536145.1 PA0069 family radical SAM protein [Stenotrophomonas sp. STM01]